MVTQKDIVEKFIAHIEKERRLSTHTVKNYLRDITTLFALVTKPHLEDFSPHDIRKAIALLNRKGMASSSIARSLSTWRSLFAFLVETNGFKQNPCLGIRAPKNKKHLPKTLTPDETAQLLDIKSKEKFSTRDRAIFETFYSSGLRLSELVMVTTDSLDLQAGTVRVVGKGNKTRIVPLGKKAIEAINDWLEHKLSINIPETEYVFTNEKGMPISPRTLQHRLSVWAKKQGLPQNVHPHMLRHSFASHVLQSSGDLRAVQEMLGHASISTTQIYTHLDWQHLAKVYDQAHPRAKNKNSK